MYLKVNKEQKSIRIDKFLFYKINNKNIILTRNKIKNYAKIGNILVNGNTVKPNYRIKPFDIIKILIVYSSIDKKIIPQNIPINIIYEDEYLILINKPSGMVVHPSFGHNNNTLLNAFKYYLKKETIVSRDGLVHRIDKDTSGLIIISKNEYCLQHLLQQFFYHTIIRKYIALVWGNISNNTGTITGHIGRNLFKRKQMNVFPDGKYGKYAVTHYKVLKRFKYVNLVSCYLETGRTHQIRVHFKYIGHPVFNDHIYGGNKIILKNNILKKDKEFLKYCLNILPRQALHAFSLGFIHPFNKKKYYFKCPLPNDINFLIKKLNNKFNK
ncbi:MAG: RluA family pseudouridine synthase [Candidatus Bostrichicola ureolyticus]|nr:MAG: RluA family pseudouridine synthase [Candidatus Bostrichicola ureolyticus]